MRCPLQVLCTNEKIASIKHLPYASSCTCDFCFSVSTDLSCEAAVLGLTSDFLEIEDASVWVVKEKKNIKKNSYTKYLLVIESTVFIVIWTSRQLSFSIFLFHFIFETSNLSALTPFC